MDITDNVDCILISLEDEAANDRDIADFTAQIILEFGEGRLDRQDFSFSEKKAGEFSIVVMKEDEIVVDKFYNYLIFPTVGVEPGFTLRIEVDPKRYGKRYIMVLLGMACNLTELNHLFGHFIKALVCDLTTKRY